MWTPRIFQPKQISIHSKKRYTHSHTRPFFFTLSLSIAPETYRYAFYFSNKKQKRASQNKSMTNKKFLCKLHRKWKMMKNKFYANHVSFTAGDFSWSLYARIYCVMLHSFFWKIKYFSSLVYKSITSLTGWISYQKKKKKWPEMMKKFLKARSL